MIHPQVLLDTDTLSAYMREESATVMRAEAYLEVYDQLSFSVMTRYEITRGLKAKGATAKLKAFEDLCSNNRVLPITDELIEQATNIYAELYIRGKLIGDADILIAATALVHGMALATNNERHFSRINDLQIENWLK